MEKELFASIDQLPEKHNLSFYPTVNDLQNHIHQAVEDIENGMLPVSAHMVRSNTRDCRTRGLTHLVWLSIRGNMQQSMDAPHGIGIKLSKYRSID